MNLAERRRLRFPLKLRLALLILCLALLLALALAWSGTPLREQLRPELLLGRLQSLGQAAGPGLAILAFALALSLAIPLTLLTLLMMAAMGPLPGTLCALTGALIGATLSHSLGWLLGHAALCQMGGPRIRLLSQSLGRRGLLAVITLRLLPIAPFAMVNMVAGATHIRLRDMLLGTLIGMLPSTLAMAFFLDRIVQAFARPGPLTWGLLASAVCLLAGGAWLLRRWLRQQAAESEN